MGVLQGLGLGLNSVKGRYIEDTWSTIRLVRGILGVGRFQHFLVPLELSNRAM